MPKINERKCQHCQEFFLPDYRNIDKQTYCRKPECRKASKESSQKRWLRKPENQNYFRGPVNVKRVQEWRIANPGYSCRKKDTLQEHCQENTIEIQEVKMDPVVGKPEFVAGKSEIQQALQDICKMEPAVLIGIIAIFTGSTLQEDIAETIKIMHQMGLDILNGPTLNEEGQNDRKEPNYLERQPL
jgi:hypothetical protein